MANKNPNTERFGPRASPKRSESECCSEPLASLRSGRKSECRAAVAYATGSTRMTIGTGADLSCGAAVSGDA